MKVLVQAGHHPNGGAAPGEAAWTYRLAQLLATRLRVRGVSVTVVGDWYGKTPPAACAQDWDLFLALHYDAAIYARRGERNTGCFADRARRDPAAARSDRFIALWESIYPEATDIPLASHRRNGNTWGYYAFEATTARTPGVLIEHGCGAPLGSGGFPPGEDAAFLHGEIETVADADAAAVLAFFGVLGTARPAARALPEPRREAETALTGDERKALERLRALSWNEESIVTAINKLGRAGELGRELRDARSLPAERLKAIGAELAAMP